MHKVRSILVLFLLSLMHAGVAHAQWVQTNGPYGGVVLSFAVSCPASTIMFPWRQLF